MGWNHQLEKIENPSLLPWLHTRGVELCGNWPHTWPPCGGHSWGPGRLRAWICGLGPLNIYDDSEFWWPFKQESHADFIYLYIYICMHIYMHMYKCFHIFPLDLVTKSRVHGILVALKKHIARLKKGHDKTKVGCTLSITRCKAIRRKFALTKVILFFAIIFLKLFVSRQQFSLLFCMF